MTSLVCHVVSVCRLTGSGRSISSGCKTCGLYEHSLSRHGVCLGRKLKCPPSQSDLACCMPISQSYLSAHGGCTGNEYVGNGPRDSVKQFTHCPSPGLNWCLCSGAVHENARLAVNRWGSSDSHDSPIEGCVLTSALNREPSHAISAFTFVRLGTFADSLSKNAAIVYPPLDTAFENDVPLFVVKACKFYCTCIALFTKNAL